MVTDIVNPYQMTAGLSHMSLLEATIINVSIPMRDLYTPPWTVPIPGTGHMYTLIV